VKKAKYADFFEKSIVNALLKLMDFVLVYNGWDVGIKT
tara:strand:+ start:670 stop:783 length:114 start_codon:yes stop_codon:yes gene_type:complete